MLTGPITLSAHGAVARERLYSTNYSISYSSMHLDITVYVRPEDK